MPSPSLVSEKGVPLLSMEQQQQQRLWQHLLCLPPGIKLSCLSCLIASARLHWPQAAAHLVVAPALPGRSLPSLSPSFYAPAPSHSWPPLVLRLYAARIPQPNAACYISLQIHKRYDRQFYFHFPFGIFFAYPVKVFWRADRRNKEVKF